MGDDRIGYVQYLRDSEAVEVAIGVFYALRRAVPIRRRGPPVGYPISECDVGKGCPGDDAQAGNAPAQPRKQAHEGQKSRETLETVMANVGRECGGWIRNVVEVVRKMVRGRK